MAQAAEEDGSIPMTANLSVDKKLIPQEILKDSRHSPSRVCYFFHRQAPRTKNRLLANGAGASFWSTRAAGASLTRIKSPLARLRSHRRPRA